MGLDGSSFVLEDIGKQILTYGRRLTPAEIFARIDSIDIERIKDVAFNYLVNKPVAVAGYGPIEDLPPIEWFQEKDSL